MKSSVTIFTDAKSEKNARVVLNRVKQRLDHEPLSESCQPYHKGGFVCRLEVDTPAANWEETPYGLLRLCQAIGRSWLMSGSIEDEFDAWSNEPGISGVTSIHVQCLRQA